MSKFAVPLSRRGVLIAGSAALILPGMASAAETPTPAQTEGPFYPRTFPLDTDNDLVRIAGRDQQASGDILHVVGRVLDVNGKPVPRAQVEIWQCDKNGVYHHVNDRSSAQRDPNFQGYGKTVASTDGGYRFRTIKPVAYPGRTPHIHFTITAPGGPRLTTQMYVAGEPRNDNDGILRAIRDPAARARVIVALKDGAELEPATLLGNFDIVLGA
jgi:protocatechuate 3,4-dioxygenase beta subunit